MTIFRGNLKEVWSCLTWPDLVSAAVAAAGLLASIFDLRGGLFSFLKYLAVVASVYLLVRLIGWWRNRLLWSLRNRLIVAYLFIATIRRLRRLQSNRLIVAYLFIAVVPFLSIVTLAVLEGRILYSQLGAYLL